MFLAYHICITPMYPFVAGVNPTKVLPAVSVGEFWAEEEKLVPLRQITTSKFPVTWVAAGAEIELNELPLPSPARTWLTKVIVPDPPPWTTVNPLLRVALWVSGLVTAMLRAPAVALAAIVMLALSWDAELNAQEFTVIPEPKL